MVVDRRSGQLSHHVFSDLSELLAPNDLLVANRSEVIPARLRGKRVGSGGRVEALLLRQTGTHDWQALMRPARRLAPGSLVEFERDGKRLVAEVGAVLANGQRSLRVADPDVPAEKLLGLGEVPLPPYIRWTGRPDRYQTVYADRPGSAAAPTAGLHFTPQLLARLREGGVGLQFVTLHVGPDTFRPIRGDSIRSHELHAEWADVSGETLAAIRRTRERGGRVVAVGTTTVRALESAASAIWAATGGCPDGWRGWTKLFIEPGHAFRCVDVLITNFHLPRSTLLVLVSAFAGRERVLTAYRQAIEQRYRFYSFGDAMLLI
jgi:S-adenosylmethionine:tRNA ribosyltransferase-isomerase